VENEVSFKYEDFKKGVKMQQDYTINDAHHDGFECGLLYMLRYNDEELASCLTDEELELLAAHLAKKKPWKTAEEWEAFIINNIFA
jgi:hypothetical protein